MLIFCNTPDESQTRPNCRHCYTITKLSSVPAEWFCRGIRRVQRDDDELVPVAFEIGGVSGAVALAFQLAVSFGHVHLERIAPLSAPASVVAGAPPSADDLTAPSNP